MVERESPGRDDWLDTLRCDDWLTYLSVAGSRGELGPEAISALLEAMGGEDETTRDRADFFLTHFDIPGLIPYLLVCLNVDALRRRVIWVLRKIGPKHERELLTAAKETSKNTRWWLALAMLESLQDEQADGDVRASARRVLQRLGKIVIPPCLNMLRSEDSEERIRGSYMLLLVGPGTIRPLANLLNDEAEPEQARASAAYVLGEIGHLDGGQLPLGVAEIQPALFTALDDSSRLVKRFAMKALLRLDGIEADEGRVEEFLDRMRDMCEGPEPQERATSVHDVVMLLLHDENEDARSAAAHKLRDIDENGEAAAGLLQSLRGTELDIPFWTAYAIGRYGIRGSTVIEELATAMREEAQEELEELQGVEDLAYALGVQMTGADIVSQILESVNADRRNVRLWTAYALGNLKGAAVPAIARFLLQHRCPQWEPLARCALHLDLRLAESIQELIGLLRVRGRDQIVPRWAWAVLARIGLDAVQPLIEAAHDNEVRRQAIRVLGNIGLEAKDAIPFLMQEVKAPYQWRRQDAAKALGKIGAAAVPYLIGSLDSTLDERFAELDKKACLRREVAVALGRIGAKAAAAVPALAERLQDTSEDEGVRREAARSLGVIAQSPNVAVPALIEALTDIDPTVSDMAASVLRRFGKLALRYLKQALDADPHHKAVQAILEAIDPSAVSIRRARRGRKPKGEQ